MSALGLSSIFVVIPAYNEALALPATVAPLVKAGYSVVVVDDGSTDSTRQTLEKLDGLHKLFHAVNLGQGAALQTGMQYARASGASIIVHFDSDGQHDPLQIPALVTPIAEGETDVVFGSRFLRPSDLKQIPSTKRVLLRGGRIVSGILTGLWLSDTHNGFRALSAAAADKIHLRENGFAHATEILDLVRIAKLRYVEVPTTIRYTSYSRAKGQRMSNAINILLDVLMRKLFL
ncbi:MAG: glycosyltransferase family 2 protein [Terracidiphilus sp.]|jgi:glycosyltransferase involved in cell wall biosynthesis